MLLDISRARHGCSTSRRHCFCLFVCFYNLLLLPLQECEVQWLWMFFFLPYFVGVDVNVFVFFLLAMVLSVLAGGCCWFFLLRTVKRINLCLFFVSSLTDWIRLFFSVLMILQDSFVFFFSVAYAYFLPLFSLHFFSVVVDNLYPLLFSFLWFSLILILVVYL